MRDQSTIDAVPRRLSITLLTVTVVMAFAWSVCFILSILWLAMAHADGVDSPDGIDIILIGLAYPVAGSIFGWVGAWYGKRRFIVSGIFLMASWLLFLAGWVTYQRLS